MSAFRRLKAYALGQNLDTDVTAAQLQAAEVPVSEAPCRGCADPCDEGHDEYPSFDVDMETEMLGSVKPYGRQVVISTGKSDWAREVTMDMGSLAAHLSTVASPIPFIGGGRNGKEHKHGDKHKDKPKQANGHEGSVSGVFTSDLAKVKKVSVLNGSHRTVSEDDDKQTALVFPDYKVITEIEVSSAGANDLWDQAVSPSLPLYSAPPADPEIKVKSWLLPYACVILLCSHKRRDNRCAIVAPKLEHALATTLEREGWEVHNQVEDPSLSGPALEDDAALAAIASEDEKQDEILRRLQRVGEEHKRALILYCSHIGGHKYAGNVIINTPRGVSVWYGRVTPHEVEAIVKETIIGGKVLPALLRGGMNLFHPGYKSLNDW